MHGISLVPNPERRTKRNENDVGSLRELSIDVEMLNLQDYFGKRDELEKKLEKLGAIFIIGGTCSCSDPQRNGYCWFCPRESASVPEAQSERTIQSRATTHAERAISSSHQDSARNIFGLFPIYTAHTEKERTSTFFVGKTRQALMPLSR